MLNQLIRAVAVQARSWWPVAKLACFGPIMASFNRTWRYRLGECRQTCDNPFVAHQAELSEFLSPSLAVQIPNVAARIHNVSAFEVLAVASLVAQCRCQHIFEIGTFDGRTTRAMAMNVADDARVFTLNIPEEEKVGALNMSTVDGDLASRVQIGERFAGTPEATRITQLWGDSATFDYSPYAGQMDLVFIDGAHSYEYARNDTERAIELLRGEGGLVVWHDAPLFGVAEYLRELLHKQNLPLCLIKGTTLAVTARVDEQFVHPVDYSRSKQPATAGENAAA